MFERTLMAGWGDMDFNGHMRNTAYLDKSGDMRMLHFAERGFPMSEFARLRLGPVVRKDDVKYFREVNLLDNLRCTLSLAGISANGSRWALQNDFYRPDGKPAARVSSAGGWLDLAVRRLCVPPPALLAAMNVLTRTEQFTVLPDSA